MAAIDPLTLGVLVNTDTVAGQQTDPLVTVLTDGRYVIVWRDEAQARSFAQFYSAAGVTDGAPIVVDTTSSVRLTQEAIVAMPGGGFAFAFMTSSNNVLVRTVSSTGALGALTQANMTAAGLNAPLQLHAVSSDTVQVSWYASSHLVANTVTSAGVIGTPRLLDTSGVGAGQSIANYAGGYVVTWIAPSGVDMRRFASDGTPIDAAQQRLFVSPQGTAATFLSTAVSLSNGGFAIVWSDGTNSGTFGAPVYHETFRAQIYDATGTAVGGPVELFKFDASTVKDQSIVWTAIGTSDGGFIVGAAASRPNGDPATAPVQTYELSIHSYSAYGQETSRPQILTNGSLAAGQSIEVEFGNVQATRLANGSIVFTWGRLYAFDTGDVLMSRYSYNTPTSPNGTAGDDSVVGGGSGALLNLSQGGHDVATGTVGNDGFYFGATFDALDIVDAIGGFDQVALQGDYAAGLTFGASNLIGVEQLVLLSGAETAFGGTGANRYSYNLTAIDATLPVGQVLTISANTLLATENFTFNGSAETNGAFVTYGGAGIDTITGGQQNDGFFFGTGLWGPNDRVDGQGGTLDQLALSGNFSGANAVTFGANQIANVEVLVVLPGDATPNNYVITMNDGNIAAGAFFAVSANQLAANESLTLNAAAETNAAITVYGGAGNDVLILGALADTVFAGRGNDRITGGGGADQLTGGADADAFAYLAVSDSTPAARDHILDFATGDRIEVSGFDANANVAGVQPFTFIGTNAFSGVAGQLRAFNIDGFDWYVNGDTNGDRIADFSILVTVPDGHALTIADFTGALPGQSAFEVIAPDFGTGGEHLARTVFTIADLPLDAQAVHAMIG